MKFLWVLSWVCGTCHGPYIGVDGKQFQTIDECRQYANERISKMDLTHETLEWWCSKQEIPTYGAFEAKAREDEQ